MLSGYVEVHHVVPVCIGGTNERSNLVQLTAEEHFVAHQLLCKMYPDVRGLAFAVQAMTASNRLSQRTTNKLFGWLRKRYAKAQKGRVKSAQERANISAARRKVPPRVFSEEARANMSAARRKTWEERRKTGEHLVIGAKVKEARLKNGTYNFSEEHKKNIGLSRLGRTPWNKGVTGYSLSRKGQ